MEKVTVHEAKTNLSRLLRRIEAGEEIIICRGKTAVARLTGISKPEDKREPRKPGRLKGLFEVPDAFFEPLSDEEMGLTSDIIPDE